MGAILNMLPYGEKIFNLSFTCRGMLTAMQEADAWEHVVALETKDVNDFFVRHAGYKKYDFCGNRCFTLVCEVVDGGSDHECRNPTRQSLLHVPVVLSQWSNSEQLQKLCGVKLVVDVDNLRGTRAYAESTVSKQMVLIQRGDVTCGRKAENAASGGAWGMLVFDNRKSLRYPDIMGFDLSYETPTLPAVATTREKGEALQQLMNSGIVRITEITTGRIYFQRNLLTDAMRNLRVLMMSLVDFNFSDGGRNCKVEFMLRGLRESCCSMVLIGNSSMFREPHELPHELLWHWIITLMLRLRFALRYANAALELQASSTSVSSFAMKLSLSRDILCHILTRPRAVVENRRRRIEASSSAEAATDLCMHEVLLLSENPFLWISKKRDDIRVTMVPITPTDHHFDISGTEDDSDIGSPTDEDTGESPHQIMFGNREFDLGDRLMKTYADFTKKLCRRSPEMRNLLKK